MAPRTLNKLSAKKAENLRTPGRHSDGGGLFLAIDKWGRRRWVFMYVRRGRRVELGLGGGRDMPLAAARTEAATLRAALVSGQDPKQIRARDDHIPTFGECADAYIEAMAVGLAQSQARRAMAHDAQDLLRTDPETAGR